MKKYSYIILAALALAAASCSVKENFDTSSKAIRFTTNLGDYATKVTDTNFEEGDAVSLFVQDPINALNVKMSFSGDELVPEQQICWPESIPASQNVDFFAVYPYRADWEDFTDTNVFSVNADQTTHELYSASDLLGATYMAYPDCETVPLNFTHKLSKLSISVSSYSEIGDIDKPVAVYVDGAYGKVRVSVSYRFDVATVGDKGTVKMGKIDEYVWEKGCETRWTAILPPQTMEFKIVVVTESGKQHVFKASKWSSCYMESARSYSIYLNYSDDMEETDGSINEEEWTADNDVQFGNYIADEFHTEGLWAVRKPGEPLDNDSLYLDGEDLYGEYTFVGGITVEAGQDYELVYCIGRKEDVYGLGATEDPNTFTLVKGGSAFKAPVSGDFVVRIYNYKNIVTVLPDNEIWSVIGEFGNSEDWWNVDFDMTRESYGLYTIELDNYWGQQFKFRCNHAWNKDFGGYDQEVITGTNGYSYMLSYGGYNMTMADGGKYQITLDTQHHIIQATLLESKYPEGYTAMLGEWTYQVSDDVHYDITIQPDGYNLLINFDEEPIRATYNNETSSFDVPFQLIVDWTDVNYGLIYDIFRAYYINEDGGSVGSLYGYGDDYADLVIYSGALSADGNLDISPGSYYGFYTVDYYRIIGLIQEGDYAGYYFDYYGNLPLPQVWTRK